MWYVIGCELNRRRVLPSELKYRYSAIYGTMARNDIGDVEDDDDEEDDIYVNNGELVTDDPRRLPFYDNVPFVLPDKHKAYDIMRRAKIAQYSGYIQHTYIAVEMGTTQAKTVRLRRFATSAIRKGRYLFCDNVFTSQYYYTAGAAYDTRTPLISTSTEAPFSGYPTYTVDTAKTDKNVPVTRVVVDSIVILPEENGTLSSTNLQYCRYNPDKNGFDFMQGTHEALNTYVTQNGLSVANAKFGDDGQYHLCTVDLTSDRDAAAIDPLCTPPYKSALGSTKEVTLQDCKLSFVFDANDECRLQKLQVTADKGEAIIELPEGIAYIEEHVFSGINVNTLILPKSLAMLPQRAFESSFVKKLIMRGPTRIEGAFAGSDIDELHVGEGTTLIPKLAGCSYVDTTITRIIIPKSVITIQEGAFSDTRTVSIELPKRGLQIVEQLAFVTGGINTIPETLVNTEFASFYEVSLILNKHDFRNCALAYGTLLNCRIHTPQEQAKGYLSRLALNAKCMYTNSIDWMEIGTDFDSSAEEDCEGFQSYADWYMQNRYTYDDNRMLVPINVDEHVYEYIVFNYVSDNECVEF